MRRSGVRSALAGLALLAASGAWALPAPRHAGGTAAAGPIPDLAAALEAGLGRPAPRAARPPDRALVVLVDFADRPHGDLGSPAALDSLFFGSQGSVREYFLRASYGRLRLEGQVTPWLRLPETYAFYADAERLGRGVLGAYPRNARRMVEDAVRAADLHVDFAAFDNDGPDGLPASGDDDGFLDALVVVHAGRGSELGDGRDILSHSWFTTAPVRSAEGVAAWSYATVSESSPLGVCAHEYGHQLGLADLYDRRVHGRLAGGLGNWSLMAAGAWIDGGRHPADLDAASKLELGFVDAIVPAANTAGLLLRPARDDQPGDVYRIWTHGRPETEYFVVENRRRSAFEDSIPWSGMLVYHVDLTRPHNDDPEHPRVRLLQADGDQDLERHIDNWDAGDPFPGDSGNTGLGADTSPSTRAHDGSDSQVRLTAIGSVSGSTMGFDLVLETMPDPYVEAVTCRELQGDGDGIAEAGEHLQLDVRFGNRGLATGAVQVVLRTEPAGDAQWTQARADLAGLAADDTASARFVLRPGAHLGDPDRLVVRAALQAGSGWQDEIGFDLGLGGRSGFLACLEAQPSRFTRDCADPAQPWTTAALRGDADWSRELRPGEFGAVYRSARGPRYPNRVDVALVSPPFNLQAGSELRLLHAWDVQDLGAGFAADGGRVELSLDGGAWQALEPHGGYPRRLWWESAPGLAGAGVFAGRSERRWDRFDLGTRAGSARLRFRFASDDSIGATGWEVARVEVGPPTAAAGVGLGLAVEPNPVRWPARVAFRIESSLTAPARATRLHLYDVRGRLVRVLEHAASPAASGYFEWDGTDRAGRRVASGLYVARLEWGGARATCKLVVLR